MTISVLCNLNFTNFEILKSQSIFEISLQIFAVGSRVKARKFLNDY